MTTPITPISPPVAQPEAGQSPEQPQAPQQAAPEPTTPQKKPAPADERLIGGLALLEAGFLGSNQLAYTDEAAVYDGVQVGGILGAQLRTRWIEGTVGVRAQGGFYHDRFRSPNNGDYRTTSVGGYASVGVRPIRVISVGPEVTVGNTWFAGEGVNMGYALSATLNPDEDHATFLAPGAFVSANLLRGGVLTLQAGYNRQMPLQPLRHSTEDGTVETAVITPENRIYVRAGVRF